MIAANISTEHFVGMAGQGAGKAGLAVAGYEWLAAITLVCVALFFLPRFLRCGLYTIPEFLEYRYHTAARGIMALYTLAIYVCVTIVAVVYSGALALETIFGMELLGGVWLIGVLAALYTAWGGLKAVAWADLFQGSALLLGGAATLWIGLDAVGGPASFFAANRERLHVVLPSDHPVVPWTALVVGLWIPNFYYWGLNQFITQRALAARSLRQGQLGILFAAGLKLLIPFLIIFPGMIALQLYPEQLAETPDRAFPVLIVRLIPSGLRGFRFAAIAVAVSSTLASMLNSVSTILTVDLYRRYFRPDASPGRMIAIGRASTLLFVAATCVLVTLLAPYLRDPRRSHGVFTYIQEFQGYISPGVLAAFVFGLFVPKAPTAAGLTALLGCPPLYGLLHLCLGEVAFLDRMALTFGALVAVMSLITALQPLSAPRRLPRSAGLDLRPHPAVVWLGALVIAATCALYVVFW